MCSCYRVGIVVASAAETNGWMETGQWDGAALCLAMVLPCPQVTHICYKYCILPIDTSINLTVNVMFCKAVLIKGMSILLCNGQMPRLE